MRDPRTRAHGKLVTPLAGSSTNNMQLMNSCCPFFNLLQIEWLWCE